MTYFAKGYGYHESGGKKYFSCVFDVENVNKNTFMLALEKAAGLSSYRQNKEIEIENIVVLT